MVIDYSEIEKLKNLVRSGKSFKDENIDIPENDGLDLGVEDEEFAGIEDEDEDASEKDSLEYESQLLHQDRTAQDAVSARLA